MWPLQNAKCFFQYINFTCSFLAEIDHSATFPILDVYLGTFDE